jgi:hypothetical protein
MSTTSVTTMASTLMRSLMVAQMKRTLSTSAPTPIAAVSAIKRQCASTDPMVLDKARQKSADAGIRVLDMSGDPVISVSLASG